MIADIIRLSALYVLVRVFLQIAFPSAKMIVRYLFWTGLALTIVSVLGPQLTRTANDIHNVSVAYVETKQGVQKVTGAVDSVTSLPDKAEEIPLVGLGEATKYPPAQSLSEKLWPFGKKKFFDWPVKGEITQGFNDKNHGLDIACKEGTAVIVARQGKVVAVNKDDIYGNYIMVDHGGQWVTLYAHLSKAYVKNGQKLWANDAVGLSGNTGNSTGPHLHFEIRVGGKTIDPKPLMK
jgi:murein DD-endopeptidase MepM/ murein hydrolase activator NlpD